MAHEHNGHAVDDDGRRRSGDHAEFAWNAVVGVVDAALELPVDPALPVVHQRRNQVDDAGFGECRNAGRRAPVFQREAGPRVERPEKECGRGIKNHAAAVEFGPGDALAEVGARRTQVAHGFRFAESPQRLAGSGVDGHDLPALADHGVQHAIGKNRCRARSVFDPRSEIVAAPGPGDFELGEVLGVDLRQIGRRARVPGVAAQIAPFALFQTSQLRGRRQGGG